MRTAWRLTLIDMMATVFAAAVGMAVVSAVAPNSGWAALIVVGPLVGILWQRSCGGRGILGGCLGGAAFLSIALFDIVADPHGPHRPGLSSMANWPHTIILMAITCLAFGTAMGVAAWLGATAMGRPRAPDPPPSG